MPVASRRHRLGVVIAFSALLASGCVTAVKLSAKDEAAFAAAIGRGDAAAAAITHSRCPSLGSGPPQENVAAPPNSMARAMAPYQAALTADLAARDAASQRRLKDAMSCRTVTSNMGQPNWTAQCGNTDTPVNTNPQRWDDIHRARMQAMAGDVAVAYAEWVNAEWSRMASTAPAITVWTPVPQLPVGEFIRRAGQVDTGPSDTPQFAIRRISEKHNACLKLAYKQVLDANQAGILTGASHAESSRALDDWKNRFAVTPFSMDSASSPWMVTVNDRRNALVAIEQAQRRAVLVAAWDQRTFVVGDKTLTGSEVRERWGKLQTRGDEIRRDLIQKLGAAEGATTFDKIYKQHEMLMATRERELSQ